MAGVSSDSRNDGKRLEQLVAFIEGRLLPGGFTVETRKPVYDDSGVQIAELDILIKGQLGTASYSSLIECRDRPSDGVAPASWIEQLDGRRRRFNLAKVMAVSTTGFAHGAKELAEQFGVELRVLKDLSEEEVARWLPSNAPLIIRHGELIEVRVFLQPPEESANQDDVIESFDPRQALFVDRETGKSLTIMDLWRETLNDGSTFKDVEVGGPPREAIIQLKEEQLRRYTYKRGQSTYHLDLIEFKASLKITIPYMPLSQAARYLSQPAKPGSEETFVELGRRTGSDKDIVKELIVLGIPKKPTPDQGGA
jgi:hypothetical protein